MCKISVKFWIDKRQRRVRFAEAGSDFVDVLFSLLLLPLGSIVRLLCKQSGLGSLDNIYESVELLDTRYLHTAWHKKVLLHTSSAHSNVCEYLKIQKIHTPNPKSVTPDEGAFVNKALDFIITSDLRVMPTSLMSARSNIKEHQANSTSTLTERVIDFDTKEVLNLLRRSLFSKDALSEVFFYNAYIKEGPNYILPMKERTVSNKTGPEITLNLVLNKNNNKVLYAEVGEDFVDHLFRFLTLPLGLVFKLLGDDILLGGCIINLYQSVENLSVNYFKSKDYRDMLLNPEIDIAMQNPEETNRNTDVFTDVSGTYVSGPKKFMVADDLNVSPMSFISILNSKIKLPISDLIIKDVCLDKGKVWMLLNSLLTSKTVLNDFFNSNIVQHTKKA